MKNKNIQSFILGVLATLLVVVVVPRVNAQQQTMPMTHPYDVTKVCNIPYGEGSTTFSEDGTATFMPTTGEPKIIQCIKNGGSVTPINPTQNITDERPICLPSYLDPKKFFLVPTLPGTTSFNDDGTATFTSSIPPKETKILQSVTEAVCKKEGQPAESQLPSTKPVKQPEQQPQESKKATKINIPTLDLEDSDDLTNDFKALEKAIKQMSRIKNRQKVYKNSILLIDSFTELCDVAHIDCSGPFEKIYQVLNNPKSKVGDMKRSLRSGLKEIRAIYDAGLDD